MSKSRLAEKLLSCKAALAKEKGPLTFIGFDGFTDQIASAVDQRMSSESFTPFSLISGLAERIGQAAGKSVNIELVVREKKIGGNGPIFANALVEGGQRILLAGCLGAHEVEPIFLPLVERCEKTFLLGESGHSDAIEFKDGKIILGKIGMVQKLSCQEVVDRIGQENFTKALDQAALFVSANWTMMPMMNQLWRYIAKNTLPQLSSKKRKLFVDLADPAKRSDADLKDAMAALNGLKSHFEIIQGLNAAEGARLAQLFKIKSKGDDPDSISKMAVELCRAAGFNYIVIHNKRFACSADQKSCILEQSAYTDHPVLTTGAGDNFNAGYCNALLYGLEQQAALISGQATAGYYVRYGKSPTMDELAIFLRKWDKGAL